MRSPECCGRDLACEPHARCSTFTRGKVFLKWKRAASSNALVTRICLGILLAIGALATHAAAPPRNDGTSWPTLHGDLQRSGFYPHFPKSPLKLTWRKELHSELTGPRAEVIVGDGLAFMGTYEGKVYAWDARSGEEKWVFKTGGPVGHAPMIESGVLYVGSMDRKLYALDAATGKVKWSFTAGEGIWTSPVAFGGSVMFGARDGVFHALDARSGAMRWSIQTGDRILTSASISEDGQSVVFASEDMHVYCAALKDGGLRWKSKRLHGLSMRDYAPVVFRGLVFVTTNPVKDFHAILGENQEMLVQRTGFSGKDNRYIAGTADDIAREQEFIVEHLKRNPSEQTFYALRMEDGTDPWLAPILYTGGLHNPLTPPCFNPHTGDVFTFVRSAYGVWDGGGEVRPFTGVGKLDLKTGRVQLIEHGHVSKEPGRPAGRKDMPWNSFATIGDETQALSCSDDFLFCTHQGSLGAMNFKSRLTQSVYGKRDTYGGFYGPGTFGWEQNGGYEKASAAGQPFGIVNEWHGPARSIVAVAGDRVYFHTGSQVICLEGAK